MRKSNCLLLFICLVVGAAGLANAQRRPAPITWVEGGETWVIIKGEEVVFEAKFFSRVPIANAHWWMTPPLHRLFGFDQFRVTLIGYVEPDRVYSVSQRFRIPEEIRPGLYTGSLMIFHQDEPNVDWSHRVYPEVLSLKIYVMEDNP